MAGLLGGDYVSVDLGSAKAPKLNDGDEIPTEATPDLNSVMSDLGDVGQELQTALGSLSTAMNGKGGQPGLLERLNQLVADNSENLSATIANLQKVTAKLNSTDGTLGLLINDPRMHDELLGAVAEFKQTATDARGLLANAQSIVERVKTGEGAIGALVYDEKAGNDLKATVQNLRTVSDKLAKGEGTLGRLLSDDSLYFSVKSTIKKANNTLNSMGDSGPITAVGIVAQGLF